MNLTHARLEQQGSARENPRAVGKSHLHPFSTIAGASNRHVHGDAAAGIDGGVGGDAADHDVPRRAGVADTHGEEGESELLGVIGGVAAGGDNPVGDEHRGGDGDGTEFLAEAPHRAGDVGCLFAGREGVRRAGGRRQVEAECIDAHLCARGGGVTRGTKGCLQGGTAVARPVRDAHAQTVVGQYRKHGGLLRCPDEPQARVEQQEENQCESRAAQESEEQTKGERKGGEGGAVEDECRGCGGEDQQERDEPGGGESQLDRRHGLMGASERPAPTTSNTAVAVHVLEEVLDVVQANIADLTYPKDPGKKWVKLSNGNYVASIYNGAPRLEKIVDPTPVPPTGAREFRFKLAGFKEFVGVLEPE